MTNKKTILHIGDFQGCKILLEADDDGSGYLTASMLQKIMRNGLQIQMVNDDKRFKKGDTVIVMEFDIDE